MEAAAMRQSLNVSAVEFPDSPPAEDVLLRRALAGDAAALTRLIEEYRPRIYSFALSQLRRREDAEDVTQETFVRMVRMMAGYQGRGRFAAWLYRIAANACRDQQKRCAQDRR